MSSTLINEQPKSVDKGKGRAHDPSERTPLLSHPSQSYTVPDEPPTPVIARRRLLSKLTFVFLVSLLLCIVAFVVLALLAWSYASRASNVSPDDILNNALVFRGPDRINVLNITSTGEIWVNLEARVGVDAGSILDVDSDPDEDASLSRDIWKSIGRWGVRKLDRVSVSMSTVNLTLAYDPSTILASVDIAPVEVALTADLPSDVSWLSRISVPLLIRPTSNSSVLLHFVREAWRTGSAAIETEVGSVVVRGGGLKQNSWRSVFHGQLSNVRAGIRLNSK